MWKRQVGERVHQLRRERNLTRAEFGELIGKSEQYVGNIERGTHIISAAVVIKICDTTGTTADFILRGMADPMAMVASLSGFSSAQIQVSLEVAGLIIKHLRTENGNNSLLHEAYRRSQQSVFDTPQ